MKQFIFAILLLSVLPLMAQNFSDFLPESTPMVISLRSISNLLAKFDVEKHGKIIIPLKHESSRNMFDVTNPEEYLKKGLVPNKPIGFAFLDQSMKTMAFFFSIQDGPEFRNFFKSKVKNFTTKPCPVGGEFIIQGNENATFAVHYIKDNNWFVIISSDYMARFEGKLVKIATEVFSAEKKLANYKPFQECQSKLDGNFFMYMDYAAVTQKSMEQSLEVLPEEQKKIIKNLQQISEEFTCIGFDANWDKKVVTFSYFIGFKEGSKLLDVYKSNGTCQAMLEKMKPDPLLCMVSVGDWEKAWDFNKGYIDTLLKLLPIPENMQSLDSLFKSLEMVLKENFKISINVEKDVIKNIEGSSILAIYDLPKDLGLDFDLVLGMKLKKPEVMKTILDDLMAVVTEKFAEVPLAANRTENNVVYSVDAAKVNPGLAISPSLSIVDDYLLFTSKKAVIDNIINKKGNLLEGIKNPIIAQGMKDGIPNVGFIKVGKIMQQLAPFIPSEEFQNALLFTNHLLEIRWVTLVGKNGLSGQFQLEADGDILEQIIIEVDNLEKKLQEKYEREEQERQALEEQERKERENSESQEESSEPAENYQEESSENTSEEEPAKTTCDCDDCTQEGCPCHGNCNDDCNCNCDEE